jgi:fructose-bisphosphate aldolase class I
MNEEQLNEMGSRRGFIAALDQSGGSTPKALALYGIPETAYGNEGQMFDLMHQARARLIESPSFTGDKILATILFEQTLDRTINGEDTVAFLWKQKHIVPFVKVDQGLADVQYGVQLMKPMTKLDSLLERAVEKGVFGTKMRSFIQEPNDGGIKAIVDQQFDSAEAIAQHDLMPIIEPEVSIKCTNKATADRLLVEAIQTKLDELPHDRQVMIKLTLPD